jgi:hypothetical protein
MFFVLEQGVIATDGAILTALISGAVAIGVVALTHYFGRKRDHEADWRKLKLEHYKEYVLALSRVVGRDSDPTAQRRYADAANSLTLVAPPSLLVSLYAFQVEVAESNQKHDPLRAESLLNVLMRNMREDCHPRPPRDSPEFTFRVLDIPHYGAADSNVRTQHQRNEP